MAVAGRGVGRLARRTVVSWKLGNQPPKQRNPVFKTLQKGRKMEGMQVKGKKGKLTSYGAIINLPYSMLVRERYLLPSI